MVSGGNPACDHAYTSAPAPALARSRWTGPRSAHQVKRGAERTRSARSRADRVRRAASRHPFHPPSQPPPRVGSNLGLGRQSRRRVFPPRGSRRRGRSPSSMDVRRARGQHRLVILTYRPPVSSVSESWWTSIPRNAGSAPQRIALGGRRLAQLAKCDRRTSSTAAASSSGRPREAS
jgi:hypothetical protein